MSPPTELSAASGAPAPEAADNSVVVGSTSEVSEVLRQASADGHTVVVKGRGTKLGWGNPPTSADVLLDLSGLDRVLDHAAGDLIVATEAGTTWAALQETVGEGGQRLAIDEVVPGASIGGALATNTSGPLRMAYGTLRDLLIGVTFVRADGVVAKAGGRVVKNVAGYDFGKLLIGSYGTLGVITEAVFRLHPRPAARRWLAVEVGDPDDALRQAQAIVHSQCVPAALELEWTGGRGRLSVLLEGRHESLPARADVVRREWGAATTTADDGAPTSLWESAQQGEQSTVLKMTTVLSGLADVLRAVDECGSSVSVQGSAGAGVLYASIERQSAIDSVVTAVDRLRATCIAQQGSLVVLDAPSAVKSAVDVWGPVPAIDLMRRVKDQLDPEHRLSPGRFVGGI